MFDHAVSRDPDSGLWTIVAWGPLGQGYHTRLNDLVRRCLAEHAHTILLDLHAVTPTDGLLPVVLIVLNRAVAKEGARLVVTAAPAVTSTLPLTAHRELTLYGHRDEAERAAALALPPAPMLDDSAPHASPAMRWRLRAGSKAIEYTSTAVSEACLAWNIPGTRAKLELIASELVANAIEHAGAPVDVSLSMRKGYVHLRVGDGSPRRPVHRPVGGAGGRGRGLTVVDENATAWGVTDRADGKVVWTILRVHAGQRT